MNLPFKTTEYQQKQFIEFFNMLVETNKQFNLTTITDPAGVAEKHFFDSIQAVPFISENANIIDIGAGAGFPGIPLKIMRPDINLTMIDSLNKRINFLNNAGSALSLRAEGTTISKTMTGFNAIHSRAEDFAKQNREAFDIGIARAVAPLPTLCELVAPFIKTGGKLILYKGSDYEREINESKNAFNELGLKLDEVFKYYLPDASQMRFLVILKKVRQTPVKYPRPGNKPKTNPL